MVVEVRAGSSRGGFHSGIDSPSFVVVPAPSAPRGTPLFCLGLRLPPRRRLRMNFTMSDGLTRGSPQLSPGLLPRSASRTVKTCDTSGYEALGGSHKRPQNTWRRATRCESPEPSRRGAPARQARGSGSRAGLKGRPDACRERLPCTAECGAQPLLG